MLFRLRIKKGNHYPFPYIFFGLPKFVRKNNISQICREYMFTDSCLFDLHNVDQLDVNKLFGFSIGNHHTTSFRFGWRPIIETNQIELIAYEYHDGIRQPIISICKVVPNKFFKLKLVYDSQLQSTRYCVTDSNGTTSEIINYFTLKKAFGFGYTLGLYFGGNLTAPQDITIYKNEKF